MATTQIEKDAILIQRVLEQAPRNEYVDRNQIAERSGLSPDRVNDAMALLVNAGHAEWIQTFGTAPFDFNSAMITPRGRYEKQRLEEAIEGLKRAAPPDVRDVAQAPAALPAQVTVDVGMRPPAPVGSPFGFTDQDWEVVATRKKDPLRLYTVLGHQFESTFFDSNDLRQHVDTMLRSAVDVYNATGQASAVVLHHRALTAGYGEHLFNEIARDVIGADIAVFETSDLNPNVMLEMGVALTWGVRVLPIKLEGRPKPPSDVSGQTWADYRDSGAAFVDEDHEQKLVRMIERALHKKVRGVV
jgi:hypothetical protein